MNSFFRRVILQECIFSGVWLSFLTAPSLAAQDPTLPMTYHNGDRQVRIEVALDRVIAMSSTPAIAGEKITRSESLRSGIAGSGAVRVVFASALANRTELEQTALIISAKSTVREVEAVCFDPEAAHPDEMFLTHRIAIQLKPSTDAQAFASEHGLDVSENLSFDNWCIFSTKNHSLLAAIDAASELVEQKIVTCAVPLIRRHGVIKGTGDPLFAQQWHHALINDASAWAAGFHGEGVNVAVVDVGVQIAHPDLIANVRADLSTNFVEARQDPTPLLSNPDDAHGTVVAGLIAATGFNDIGGRGVAYGSQIIGERLFEDSVDDATAAKALTFRLNDPAATAVDVSNSSWGLPDDGKILETFSPLTPAALQSGVINGRGKRGIIYVWACGNGGFTAGTTAKPTYSDNASYDGFVNSRSTIGVAATDETGVRASYSEPGCDVFVNAPGGTPDTHGVISTDLTGINGFNENAADPNSDDYTTLGSNYNHTTPFNTPNQFIAVAGTSFSSPIAAGVCALILQANPLLTWRDVQHVLAETASKNDPSDVDWFNNAAGKHFNIKYGFGMVNAGAAVALAPSWTRVPVESTPLIANDTTQIPIPDAPNANTMGTIERSVSISGPIDFHTEHVEFTVTVTHPFRGDLQFSLVSPSGTVSMVPYRPNDNNPNLMNWTFKSVANWGENPNGTWRLRVSDAQVGDVGTLNSWSLKIYGYQPYPVPTITSILPDGINPGSGDTTVTITGTGFATDASGVSPMTQFRWNGTLLTGTVITANSIQVTVPAALLATPGSANLVAVNPVLQGAGGGSSGNFIVPIEFAPTVSAIADQNIGFDRQTSALPFTIADVETPANQLTLSATSSDTVLIPISNITFEGTGANHTITVRPIPEAGGISAITIYASDGQRVGTSSFKVHVDTPSSKKRCGLGSLFGLMSLLLHTWRRRTLRCSKTFYRPTSHVK